MVPRHQARFPGTAARWSRSSPDPPPRRGPADHHGRGRRARPASDQSVGLPGLRPRTPAAGSRPS